MAVTFPTVSVCYNKFVLPPLAYCDVGVFDIYMHCFAAIKCIASLGLFLNDPASDGAVVSQ